ncbi:UNVERIFIED_CONTAM: hypothetical protein Slati_4225100 [Sesamum latifolium]|uniref:Reverse transcriptase domain-containing protein n=1 Tax=Sesamum latifolium TaxID=2727402 RepID=A0AAW2TBR6_9LAMI
MILRLATKLEQNMLHQRAKLAWMKGGDQCSRIFFPKPITLDEIKQAVFDIDEVKAPGPGSYSSGFLKATWPIVGEEVTRAIMELFTTGRLLKQVNSTLISLIPKNVFVPGHSIGDNILLAQELFHDYNQQHLPPRCALKVDLRKAYDTVEWDFLRAVLMLFGFPAQFIMWGDPMSPYLFVLVMEVLKLILQQFIDKDGGFSYHWRYGELHLFQLGFADDLLLFSKADTSSIHILKQGPTDFADLSGLQVNPQKSHLILSRATAPLRDTLLPILDFQEGRVQLIKSVLTALQVYWAMAFILPKTVMREIEKRLCSFLWKGCAGVGYAKVSWQQVCRPVTEGGLGIRDILALNKGLMSRHLWRVIVTNCSSIWVDWIIHYRLHGTSIWTVSDRFERSSRDRPGK